MISIVMDRSIALLECNISLLDEVIVYRTFRSHASDLSLHDLDVFDSLDGFGLEVLLLLIGVVLT